MLLYKVFPHFYVIIAHAVTLRGINNEMFRGYLVVTWNNANERVGSFAPLADGGRTACEVSMHSSVHVLG